jgi:hypothetical protein
MDTDDFEWLKLQEQSLAEAWDDDEDSVYDAPNHAGGGG